MLFDVTQVLSLLVGAGRCEPGRPVVRAFARRFGAAPGIGLAAMVVACGGEGGTSEVDASDDAAVDSVDQADAEAPPTVCSPQAARCAPASGGAVVQPPRLSEHGAAYDEATTTMVVFGGTTGVPENCDPAVAAAFVDDTWLYDDTCGRWEQLEGDGPDARGRHAMAAGGGSVWMFGGRWRAAGTASGSYVLFDDLWRFDPAARTWTRSDAIGPSARANATLVWDSARERLVLFGGNMSASGANIVPLDDVWFYSPAADIWTQASPEAGPAARLAAAGLYDAVRDQLVVFGGFDTLAFEGDVSYFDDVWALDLDTLAWDRLDRGAGPDGRFGAAWVHDTTVDTYVMFGGHDDQVLGNRNDTWVFVPSSNAWAIVGLGDAFNAPQIGFCDFPADFTTVDRAFPERRNYHTMVWSETCGRGLVFGGKTDCGAANDVWTYRDEAWQNAVLATSGEVCARFRANIDNCANLCF